MKSLSGDFCYIIWFDNIEDRNHFQKLLSKRGILAWNLKTDGQYAVVWDIGKRS